MIRLLQRLWKPVLEVLAFLKPIRFVVLPLVLLTVGIFASNQGHDAIRALVEFDPGCPGWLGIFVFVAAVTFLALQSWYWSRSLLRIDFSRNPGDPAPERDREGDPGRHATLELWAPRALGLVCYLIAGVALILVRRSHGEWGPGTNGVIVWTCILLSVAAAVFLGFVITRRRILGKPPARATSQSELGKSTQTILGLTVFLAVLFVVWTAMSPLTVGWYLSSPSLLMVSAGIWVALGSWVVYWSDRYHVPLVTTLILLAALFSFWNDNHHIRTLSSADGGGSVDDRKNVAETFTAWYGRLAAAYPAEKRHPVFVVATEGGGIRAAYWTASVLAELQDEAPSFGSHLFAVSGVSGGSLGAAVFTALLAKNDPATTAGCHTQETPEPNTYRVASDRVLSYDALAPTLASMLNADLAQRLLPRPIVPDRAKALETGWERGWSEHVLGTDGQPDDFFASGFLKMYADRPRALLPSLFLNSTSVETGARVIASNCSIGEEFPDAADLFQRVGEDMRISTTAHNSARFTYVSPAGTIARSKTASESYVVDGGYFENSGAATAADIIRTIGTQTTSVGGDFDVVLIVIKFRDSPGKNDDDRRLLTEVLAPLNALLATRDARGSLAVKEAKLTACKATKLSEACQGPPPSHIIEFTLAQQEGGIALPLGWLLAARTRNAIDLQIGPSFPGGLPSKPGTNVKENVASVKAILDWLHVPATEAPPSADRQEAAAASERVIMYGK